MKSQDKGQQILALIKNKKLIDKIKKNEISTYISSGTP